MAANIFVITADESPTLAVSGGELRNWQNVQALAQLGRVALVSLRPVDERQPAPDSGIEIVGLSKPEELSTSRILRRIVRLGRLAPTDLQVPKFVLERLLNLVRERKPDVIVVEGITFFSLLKHLRPLVPLLVLDMHNIESTLIARLQKRRVRLRNILGSDTALVRRRERRALRVVDRVWVCSADDRERLRAIANDAVPIDVVPNGIPRTDLISATLPPPNRHAEGKPVILFIGHLGYRPNVEAVQRLADAILPLIRIDFPDASLILAGRNPTPGIRALARRPNVQVFENPEGVGQFYARAHLAIVPLDSGGGTRIKLLEAMAFGLPVVATPIAAEGLGFRDGEEILIADSDAGIAAHARALMASPARYEAQRRRAFDAAHMRFGRAAIGNAVRMALSDHMTGARAGTRG